MEKELKGFKILEAFANKERKMIKERSNKGKSEHYNTKYGDIAKPRYRVIKYGNGMVKIERDSDMIPI